MKIHKYIALRMLNVEELPKDYPRDPIVWTILPAKVETNLRSRQVVALIVDQYQNDPVTELKRQLRESVI